MFLERWADSPPGNNPSAPHLTIPPWILNSPLTARSVCPPEILGKWLIWVLLPHSGTKSIFGCRQKSILSRFFFFLKLLLRTCRSPVGFTSEMPPSLPDSPRQETARQGKLLSGTDGHCGGEEVAVGLSHLCLRKKASFLVIRIHRLLGCDYTSNLGTPEPDGKFEANLGYLMSSRIAWSM